MNTFIRARFFVLDRDAAVVLSFKGIDGQSVKFVVEVKHGELLGKRES